jgi:hypothetical protein
VGREPLAARDQELTPTSPRSAPMATGLADKLKKIASVNLFKKKDGMPATGVFVGRTFYIDYDRAYLLVADKWKQDARGIPQGTFLLAYYVNEDDIEEALLLRALKPAKLPTDNDVISSMIEYYKDNLKTAGKDSKLDQYTRYEFSFSGLECRVRGTFCRDPGDGILKCIQNFAMN